MTQTKRQVSALAGLSIALLALVGFVSGEKRLVDWWQETGMMPITCWMLIVAGIMAYCMATGIAKRSREIAILSCASIIAGSLSVNVFCLGLAPDAQLYSQQPSPVTLLACLFLAIAGWSRGINENVHWSIWLSRVAGLFGGLAVLGYVLGVPAFYYDEIHPGWTAMSLPAAVVFVCYAISANGKHE